MQFTEITAFDLDAATNTTSNPAEGTQTQTNDSTQSPTGLTEFDLENPDASNNGESESFLSKEYLDKLFESKNLIPFVNDADEIIYPKSLEEFEDLIVQNKTNWEQSIRIEDEQKLFEKVKSTASPAMQFVLDNANKFRDPQQMIPLLNSVSQQEYLSNLNIEDESHQELIARKGLEIQGLPDDAIDAEITFLKEANRLQSRAEMLKPVIEKHQAQITNSVLKQREEKLKEEQSFWNSYYNKFNEDFYKVQELDGIRFKQEDKNKIASLILPNSEIGGLPIYSLIDKLVEQGDVKTLSKLALLANDSTLFDTYYGAAKSDKVATGLQKKLRDSNVSNSSQVEEEQFTKKQNLKYGYFNK